MRRIGQIEAYRVYRGSVVQVGGININLVKAVVDGKLTPLPRLRSRSQAGGQTRKDCEYRKEVCFEVCHFRIFQNLI